MRFVVQFWWLYYNLSEDHGDRGLVCFVMYLRGGEGLLTGWGWGEPSSELSLSSFSSSFGVTWLAWGTVG